jgi:hypothetical protein
MSVDDTQKQIEEAMAHAERLRTGDADASKPEFKPHDPLDGLGDEEDDDTEFGEPDQGASEAQEIEGVKPMIASLVFTGTDKGGDFDQVVQVLIGVAERSGLFYLSAFVNELDGEHVVPGSPLHQQLTGRSA